MTKRMQCGPETPLGANDAPAVVMWDINAVDAGRARAFYHAVFGWPVSEPGDAPVELAVVESGEHGIGGVIGQAPRETDNDFGIRHRGLIVYIKVHDVAASLAAIEANGGRAIWGPSEVAPGFWLAQFEDPDGVRLGLST
jgi:predicted enzyme related to lactoylglutathione lyase